MAESDITPFVDRWSAAQAAERANYQLFLTELCDVLGVPRPDPAGPDTALNAYVFERAVTFQHRDGKTSSGRIDLYKRGSFICECKQCAAAPIEPPELALAAGTVAAAKNRVARGTEAWDRAMLEAQVQAENYAHALPRDEDPPPFLLVIDVGHVIEIYADFSQKGKIYLPFPDARSHRIRLADLGRDEVRAKLRTLWLDPRSLDPARESAEVTREVASCLANLAKSFEQKHDPKEVAEFLCRCLFCMFAEDVGLLPKDSFTQFLDSLKADPGAFVPLIQGLFDEMNRGGFSLTFRKKLLAFNGGLFADASALPVNGAQLEALRLASSKQWQKVEPAIFGTLLERALAPDERHKLGAHYTPRAYVERLVLPTVIEPLREEWQGVRTAAVTLANRGELNKAIAEVRAFHHRLCSVRVLDPACGSGNFLYVALEHMKRLEGEVFDVLGRFGDSLPLDLGSETVDPHQFLGIELNPRAAAITELVLWIGYLQWHFRTRGDALPREPVLHKFQNIENRDAVLSYDREEYITAKMVEADPKIPGLPDNWRDAVQPHTGYLCVWDRKTMKTDPVSGRQVPDAKAMVPLRRYTNPRPARWPQADFIVGNPPFLGKGKIRDDLGDGYVETLRSVYTEVPDSADFVMFWWYKAAGETLAGRTRRFGFITTNSIKQTFNRRVVKRALMEGVSLRFAIPDHPWVDTVEGAAVRIAMTVGVLGNPFAEKGRVEEAPPDPGAFPGDLLLVTHETPQEDGSAEIVFVTLRGRIGSGLNIGAELEDVYALRANDLLASTGLILGSRGFVIKPDEAQLLLRQDRKAKQLIFPLRNGEDLTGTPRGAFVIDTHGWGESALREQCPHVYDHLLRTVRAERQQNRDPKLRKYWWLFRRSNEQIRDAIAGLPRYIATVETTKHRVFQFLDAEVKPEHVLIAVGLHDAFYLGVLSSLIHVVYALAAGGTLEDRPRYNKTRCFDPFPFPDCTEKQKERIRKLAEELDAHRKQAQEKHGLGLTDIYNVLEKVRAGETLTTEDKAVHEKAMVATLLQLHDELDRAVADAYGWPWPLSDEEILERVVVLNAARATDEANGTIRWLRPEYQRSRSQKSEAGNRQTELTLETGKFPAQATRSGRGGKPQSKIKDRKAKIFWPTGLADRVRAVEIALAEEENPASAEVLAKRFARAKSADVAEILQTLVALGRARPGDVKGTFVR